MREPIPDGRVVHDNLDTRPRHRDLSGMEELFADMATVGIDKQRRDKMGDWISLKDRMPVLKETVLFASGSLTFAAEYEDLTSPDAVTHWQPLPDPPQPECPFDYRELVETANSGDVNSSAMAKMILHEIPDDPSAPVAMQNRIDQMYGLAINDHTD